MNNSPQLWPDNHAEAGKKEDHEKPRVSKSSIKRDAEALKQLGVALIKLGKNASGRIPLDDDLRSAIELAQKLKKEGYRRQVQLIGKMLRARDIAPIKAALDALNNYHHHQTLLLKKWEQLRARLMTEGDAAIPDVLALYPDADRQQLRTLIRQAQKEQLTEAPPAAFRQLLRYLRTLDKEGQ